MAQTVARFPETLMPLQIEIEDQMTYSIVEHKHRFAAWAAGRAASTRRCPFSVAKAKAILEEGGMKRFLVSPDNLPVATHIDREHAKWRGKVIDAAQEQGLTFTAGIAAKLINCYLKAAFVCGGHENHPRVHALHPPIDSLLLDKLSSENIGEARAVWNEARQTRWSKFDSDQYERVIVAIRQAVADSPMWTIEMYWPGHQ